MKLALGTVQFGLPYGVANTTGQLSPADAAQTIAIAREAGIQMLDTAAAYGEAEARLGELGVGGFDIVTKLPAVPANIADVATWTETTVRRSLTLLRQPRVHAVLLHRAGDAQGERGQAIGAVLRQLQSEGAVSRIGVSVYEPDELAPIIEVFPLEVVQAPYNVFDQRIVRSGWAARIRNLGGELHVRSVFLQGMLLLGRTRRPSGFERWGAEFDRFERWLESANVPALDACLVHALSNPQVDRVIVGVDGPQHLAAIVTACHSSPRLPDASDLVTEDLQLLHPSRWAEFINQTPA